MYPSVEHAKYSSRVHRALLPLPLHQLGTPSNARLSLLSTEQCYSLASVHWPIRAPWFISVHQSKQGVHLFILITLTSRCYGFTSVHQPIPRFHLCTLANVKGFNSVHWSMLGFYFCSRANCYSVSLMCTHQPVTTARVSLIYIG